MNKRHLAEMLLDIRLHGSRDVLRSKRPFSEDIESTNAVLFNPRYDKRRKVRAYRKWLETPPNQPCVFGRIAAKNKNVFICLLEENEILAMAKGDEDVKSIIQDYRQVWKRHALEGLVSSFVIVLVSKSLSQNEPNDQLKEICRRLLELYLEISPIPDDSFKTQREYVFLRPPSGSILKFSTLPNVFCAQGDGRWWHDHRTPGGIMITSNALGHFAYSRIPKANLEEKDKTVTLESAMRTIDNAYRDSNRSKPLKHCPATFLVPAGNGEKSPLRDTSEFKKFSCERYQGYFHTDHLIPSVFFRREIDPPNLKLYEDLSFKYIFDPEGDTEDHRELMLGAAGTMFEVKRNMDRLPEFVDPDSTTTLTLALRARLAKWLEARLKELQR
jgi:hypothetical protein